jgi:hypothetical protein
MYNRLIAGYEHTNNFAQRPTGSSRLPLVEDNSAELTQRQWLRPLGYRSLPSKAFANNIRSFLKRSFVKWSILCQV